MSLRFLSCAVVACTLLACDSAPDKPTIALAPATLPSQADPPPAPAAKPAVSINPRMLRRFRPLRSPTDLAPEDRARVALGKQLFFDTRLSRHGDTSCNTCHPLDKAGADQLPVSVGTKGELGKRNAPSVYNSAWHVAQFWDGRAADLEAQATGPLFNPSEMAMSDTGEVQELLQSIPGYVEAFAAAFSGERRPTMKHVASALASFERTLVTPGRWDAYLRGDHAALDKTELEGLKAFSDLGCISCHTGELVGASMFQRVGVVTPWPNQKDQGRYEITKVNTDRMVFKVPSLRNVTRTAPYFHDGSVANLGDAIRMMGKHQLGIEVSDEEVAAIEAWMKTLDGAPSNEQVTPPTLPDNGPQTASVVSKIRTSARVAARR